jgi:hypothetical protein
VEELYPGHTAWYEGQAAKINALEQQAAEQDETTGGQDG